MIAAKQPDAGQSEVEQLRAENAELRDALAAVREALDIPYAATIGGDETRALILGHRTRHATLALRDILREDGPILGIAWETNHLREKLAEHPATGYLTDEQAHALIAQGKTWVEAVTPPEADASAAAVTSAAPAPAPAVAAVLRRTADLIEQQPYQHVDILAAITQAAAEHTDRVDHVEQLGGTVLALLAKLVQAEGAGGVRRWSQASRHEVVVAFLKAAATAHEERAGGEGQ